MKDITRMMEDLAIAVDHINITMKFMNGKSKRLMDSLEERLSTHKEVLLENGSNLELKKSVIILEELIDALNAR